MVTCGGCGNFYRELSLQHFDVSYRDFTEKATTTLHTHHKMCDPEEENQE